MDINEFPWARGASSLIGSLLGEIDQWQGGNEGERRPVVIRHQQDGSYKIAVELPGVRKEEIELKVGDRILNIKALRRPIFDEKSEGKGRAYSYQLQLSPEIDLNQIDADYRYGLLVITLRQRREQELRDIVVKG